VTETSAATSLPIELRVDLTAGRRSVSRPLGRLTVDDRELIVGFDTGSQLADVRIKLSPRKRIADMLRARGYCVIDDRT
jgi:hypothetical protein